MALPPSIGWNNTGSGASLTCSGTETILPALYLQAYGPFTASVHLDGSWISGTPQNSITYVQVRVYQDYTGPGSYSAVTYDVIDPALNFSESGGPVSTMWGSFHRELLGRVTDQNPHRWSVGITCYPQSGYTSFALNFTAQLSYMIWPG